MNIKCLKLLLITSLFTTNIYAQKIIAPENDSTFVTEFVDGNEWAYMKINGFTIGIECHIDDFNGQYNIGLIIKNNTGKSFLFDPNYVQAFVIDKKDELNVIKVIQSKNIVKSIKKRNNTAMLLNDIGAVAAGFEKRTMSTTLMGNTWTSEQTVYNPGKALQAQAYVNTENMKLESFSKNEIMAATQGYLKKNTIHDGKSLSGYIFAKRKKGKILNIIIPIGEEKYTFKWDISK